MNKHLLSVAKTLNTSVFQNIGQISMLLKIPPVNVLEAIKELERLNFPIRFSECRGYKLVHPVYWLSRSKIYQQIGVLKKAYKIQVVEQTNSTNSDLLSYDPNAHMVGHSVVRVAEIQTHGKGRRGREWLSGIGDSLTFSIMKTLSVPQKSISALSLVVGLAVVRAISDLGGVGYSLKWPNDIVRLGKKVGGILIELGKIEKEKSLVIIGIGINVRQKKRSGREGLLLVEDLFQDGMEVDRNKILAAIIKHIDSVIDIFENEGFMVLKKEWEKLHHYQGKKVQLSIKEGDQKVGVVVGIDHTGALLIKDENKIIKATIGDISLRAISEEGYEK